MCLFSKMKKTYASSGAQRSGAQTVERTTNMKPDNTTDRAHKNSFKMRKSIYS